MRLSLSKPKDSFDDYTGACTLKSTSSIGRISRFLSAVAFKQKLGGSVMMLMIDDLNGKGMGNERCCEIPDTGFTNLMLVWVILFKIPYVKPNTIDFILAK